ncbi:MAG: hypothetical protein IPI73_23510 [Betaproteobacteria bacterium]|nr:hypothetical protein [Betaproteobacteria bacterium]
MRFEFDEKVGIAAGFVKASPESRGAFRLTPDRQSNSHFLAFCPFFVAHHTFACSPTAML